MLPADLARSAKRCCASVGPYNRSHSCAAAAHGTTWAPVGPALLLLAVLMHPIPLLQGAARGAGRRAAGWQQPAHALRGLPCQRRQRGRRAGARCGPGCAAAVARRSAAGGRGDAPAAGSHRRVLCPPSMLLASGRRPLLLAGWAAHMVTPLLLATTVSWRDPSYATCCFPRGMPAALPLPAVCSERPGGLWSEGAPPRPLARGCGPLGSGGSSRVRRSRGGGGRAGSGRSGRRRGRCRRLCQRAAAGAVCAAELLLRPAAAMPALPHSGG